MLLVAFIATLMTWRITRSQVIDVFEDVSNHNLTAVPIDLLRNVTNLNLDENSINSLDSTSFALYRDLVWLSAAKNPLRVIADGTFDDCRQLRTLLLSETKLVYLPIPFGPSTGQLRILDLNGAIKNKSILNGHYLKSFQRLRVLWLTHNSLDDIDGMDLPPSLVTLNLNGNGLMRFPNLTLLESLKDLVIQGNPFTEIPINIFSGLSNVIERLFTPNGHLSRFPDPTSKTSLERVILENNDLTTIPDLLIMDLRVLRIAQNPIACDRRMCWRRMWAWIKPVPSAFDDVICQEPLAMRGRALMDVPVNQMECYTDPQFAPFFRSVYVFGEEPSLALHTFDLKNNTDPLLSHPIPSRSAIECGLVCQRQGWCKTFVFEEQAHDNGTCRFVRDPATEAQDPGSILQIGTKPPARSPDTFVVKQI